MATWLQVAVRRDIITRSVKVALVVGTILVAINHGDALLAGELDSVRILKMALTYLVPYAVSTYAAVSAIRHSSHEG